MAEQAPPRRPDITASKLRAPTRTCYFNNFFVLRTDVVLNGQPAEIGCSGSSELTLSCRYFPLPGEYSAAKPSVSYPAISGKVEEILKKHGVFHVDNFFCGDVPLFQVTFSSEYGLKQFLKNKKNMERDLAALFSEALLPSRQPGAPAINIPALVNASLFLMSPDPASKDCRPTEVTLANHSTCMALWKESEVFDFGDVFRVFRLDPTKLPDEGEMRLNTLFSELYEVTEWCTLGKHLGLQPFRLERIQIDHCNAPRDKAMKCLQSMLQVWKEVDDKASWSALVRALCAIGRTALAKKIAYKYGATLPPVLFRADQELSSADQEQQEPALSTGACNVPSQQELPAQSQLLSSIQRSDHLLEEKMTSVETVAESKTKALENYRSVRRRLSAALSNVDQLHKDKTTLMKQLDSREKALRIMEATNRKQGDHDDIIQLLKQDIKQSKELEQQKDRKIPTITAEANDLKAQLQKSTEQLESATSKLSKLKNEQEAMSSDLKSKRQELEKEQYRSLFKDLKGELAALRAEATSKAEQTGELKGRLSAKSEEVENLKKALRKAEQGKPVLPEQPSPAAILQAMETTDLRVKLATAEEGRQEVERQLGALQSQVQLLQDDIKRCIQELGRCRDTPVNVWNATTFIMNGRVYIGCTTVSGRHVLEYTPESDKWVELPKTPVRHFALAVLSNQLVLVGGRGLTNERRTNNIAVFKPSTRQWVQAYPPMPTARSDPSAIVYQHYLIVAGGEYDTEKSLSTAEVLNSINKKWYSAEQVLIKCDHMIPVVISDTAYLLGGRSDGEQTKTVLAVSLPALINKATSQPQEVNTPTSWKMLPDSPLHYSSPFTSHGMLLTAGGEDESGEVSSHINCYDPVTNQWEKVGDLPEPRSRCGCAVLPSTELLLVGGAPYTNRMSVHKATIQ